MTPKQWLTPLALVCVICPIAATEVPQQGVLEQPASHHRHILVSNAVTVAANLTATAGPPQPLPGSSIAACVPIRDQHLDILEWLEHHRSLGVGRFYVIDHGSVPPLEEVLQDFISSGTVQYFEAEEAGFLDNAGAHRPQLAMYQACLDKFRDAHRWMLFIDTDEFLVIRGPAHVSLDTFLREFEDAGGLAVNWQMLGSSGHLQRPSEGVRASYSACLPPEHATNRHVKVIANLEFTTGAGENPHAFAYAPGKTAVNELHEPVEGAMTAAVAASRIVLYHYALKSASDFQAKSERGSGMGNHKTTEFFDMVNAEATHNCTLLLGRHSRLLAPEQQHQHRQD